MPSARAEPIHDSSEPPPPGPLSLDEQVTLVQRLPKEIVKALRERESQRVQRESSRPPIARVDEESTAVFIPPPELLARAKRFQPPPKPGRNADVPPAPSDPPARSVNELPTKPPPPMTEEAPAPRSSPHGTVMAARTPAVAFPAAARTPSGQFPAAARTPSGQFPAARMTPAGGIPAARSAAGVPSSRNTQPGLRGPTPAFGFPAQAMPRLGVQRPNALKPGVPQSVPRGFTAALVPKAVVDVIAPPAAEAPPAEDQLDSEEPTSRARFAAEPLERSHVPMSSAPPPEPAAPDLEIQASPSEAPPEAAVEQRWEDEEEEAPTQEHVAPSSRGAMPAAVAAAPSRTNYLLWLGWTAAALIVACAIYITFFKK
ncbi:MAG TPA: hypothetical protein VGK73_26880 [Polyangiaceae bacterium]